MLTYSSLDVLFVSIFTEFSIIRQFPQKFRKEGELNQCKYHYLSGKLNEIFLDKLSRIAFCLVLLNILPVSPSMPYEILIHMNELHEVFQFLCNINKYNILLLLLVINDSHINPMFHRFSFHGEKQLLSYTFFNFLLATKFKQI